LTVRAACEIEASEGFVSRFLRNKWVGEVGLASFEIYLVHVIVYGIVEKAGFRTPARFLPVAYGASIALGIVFYQLFGKKAQEYVKTGMLNVFGLGKKKRVIAAAVPAVIALAMLSGSTQAQAGDYYTLGDAWTKTPVSVASLQDPSTSVGLRKVAYATARADG